MHYTRGIASEVGHGSRTRQAGQPPGITVLNLVLLVLAVVVIAVLVARRL